MAEVDIVGEPSFGARTARKVTGTALAILSFQTLGIIYGDIGTSPLYVLQGIFSADGPVPLTQSEEDVIGVISTILWTLTLVPILKYVVCCLPFGTKEGEGGTFALYCGLYPPKEEDDSFLSLTIYETQERVERIRVSVLHKSRGIKWSLLLWTLFGTALTLADGVLTPAVSVVSAVEGISVAKPSVQGSIAGISIAIIVVLFLVQNFGTAKISFLFAPVIAVWLLLLAGSGIYNITHFPDIWRAWDISRAVSYFVRTKRFDDLAGVILCITGVEALFANLGQFTAASIQLSCIFFVYPCLILAYLGQGARLITDGADILPSIFYLSIPGPTSGGLYWVTFVMAILATVIASQAMISACFSLIQQLISWRCFPPLKVVHTSDHAEGQTFIPVVNYVLMIAVIGVVLGFQTSASLTNAYGFAIATVMIVTTSLVALQIHYVKGLPVIAGIAFFIFFTFIDGLFWGATLRKVPDGAWLPLGIGLFITVCMVWWYWAKELETAFDFSRRQRLGKLLSTEDPSLSHPTDLKTASAIETITPVGGHWGQNDGSIAPLQVDGDGQIVRPETSQTMETEESDDEAEPEDSGPPRTGASPFMNPKSSMEMDSFGLRQRRGSAKPVVKSEETPLYLTIPPGPLALRRLPSIAVFQTSIGGRGAPHTFVTFLQHYPALPRVVVFLTVRKVALAHVPESDKYVVSKIRSFEGFYQATLRLGFRDPVDLTQSTDIILERIISIEKKSGRLDLESVIQEIEAVGQIRSHFLPGYYLSSGGSGCKHRMLRLIVDPIRKFLIEEVYRRVAANFPPEVGYIFEKESLIRMGVNAVL